MEEDKQTSLAEKMNKTDKALETTSNEIMAYYLCRNCHEFPKLIFKDKTVNVYCEETQGYEMDFNKYIEFKAYKSIIQRTVSTEANNKVMGYCFDCHMNLNKKTLINIKNILLKKMNLW